MLILKILKIRAIREISGQKSFFKLHSDILN